MGSAAWDLGRCGPACRVGPCCWFTRSCCDGLATIRGCWVGKRCCEASDRLRRACAQHEPRGSCTMRYRWEAWAGMRHSMDGVLGCVSMRWRVKSRPGEGVSASEHVERWQGLRMGPDDCTTYPKLHISVSDWAGPAETGQHRDALHCTLFGCSAPQPPGNAIRNGQQATSIYWHAGNCTYYDKIVCSDS